MVIPLHKLMPGDAHSSRKSELSVTVFARDDADDETSSYDAVSLTCQARGAALNGVDLHQFHSSMIWSSE